MDHHLLARRLGAPPVLLLILSCLALILAGCSCSCSSAHAASAPRPPVFAFPAAAAKAKAQHAVARHHESRLRAALDAAATRVGEALGALAATVTTPASSSS
jgi:predicted MFS family arabinose efflux permease